LGDLERTEGETVLKPPPKLVKTKLKGAIGGGKITESKKKRLKERLFPCPSKNAWRAYLKVGWKKKTGPERSEKGEKKANQRKLPPHDTGLPKVPSCAGERSQTTRTSGGGD